ncbi:MAG: hypothetical protein J6B56_00180 [Clostridia bacterium]|nr:hypothetical protein [Clostridia bacterium]
MIQNKKLFFITLLVGVLLCASIDVPILLMQKIPFYSLTQGLFFIGNAVFGAIMYSLIYRSIKKTPLIKKIYLFSLFIAILVFIMGLIIVLLAI